MQELWVGMFVKISLYKGVKERSECNKQWQKCLDLRYRSGKHKVASSAISFALRPSIQSFSLFARVFTVLPPFFDYSFATDLYPPASVNTHRAAFFFQSAASLKANCTIPILSYQGNLAHSTHIHTLARTVDSISFLF